VVRSNLADHPNPLGLRLDSIRGAVGEAELAGVGVGRDAGARGKRRRERARRRRGGRRHTATGVGGHIIDGY
jgi:hypothetical protein